MSFSKNHLNHLFYDLNIYKDTVCKSCGIYIMYSAFPRDRYLLSDYKSELKTTCEELVIKKLLE